jgi:SAM-dependent methyltransferase
MTEYVLGVNPQEYERLRFQQGVWGETTRAFLSRLGVARGARCIDLGCGPGFVLDDLRALAGDEGAVVALDESETWIRQVRDDVKRKRQHNVRAIVGRIEDAPLEGTFDLVFARWVFSFLPDPRGALRRMVKFLTPGGVVAIQDYNHEGVSLFPESEGFRDLVRGTRALYKSTGGDPWIAAKLPGWLRESGLRPVDLTPRVLCGGPGTPVFEWADRFFPVFAEPMVRAGVLTEVQRARFLSEWAERKANPDALFFSPIVVGVAAVKPKESTP